MCTTATSFPTIISTSLRSRFYFNSKSPEWGEARLDRSGILVGEMVARNDLIVLNRGRGGKARSPSLNTRRLSKDKLRENVEETRLIDEFGWARSDGSLEDTVRTARRKVSAA